MSATWTGTDGTVWGRPTARAYAQVCMAQRAATAALSEILAERDQLRADLAAATARADTLRTLVKDICAEWNESCDCEERGIDAAAGHGDECKATSIAAAKRALNARAQEVEKDAARWDRLVELWHCGELSLAQTDEGGWSISLIEPVDDVMFQPLRGDTPDAAIDAARVK